MEKLSTSESLAKAKLHLDRAEKSIKQAMYALEFLKGLLFLFLLALLVIIALINK